MNPSELQAFLDEPACAHNKKSKSGCAKPQPGATQGGCAFDGARNALLPIADVAHIVHGPIGCAGSSWDGRGTRSSGPSLFRIGMTTDLSDLDVIMGQGEKRLFRSIKQAVETYKPAAVFVYVTCVPALHGDDVGAVAKVATERFGLPVITVDCAGFYGNKNLGNRVAADVIYRPCRWNPRTGPGVGGGPALGYQNPRHQSDRRMECRRRVLECRAFVR